MATPRVRTSPFFEATLRYGAKAFTIYNHAYMPVFYESPEADYEKLVTDVTIWDVGCQRQVEITGSDAAAFTQYLVTRDIERCAVGQAKYTLVCDDEGGILNDPVMLRLAENHFWLSLADRDILLWARGVVRGTGFDVAITEPDVSPLQVQGPKAHKLMTNLLGPVVDSIRFFWFIETELDGVPIVVSRTGWSGEHGYEIFLRDGSKGDWLWKRLFAAGADLGVAPAAPSNIRRIEAGLLSYLGDMDETVNPYEAGLGWVVDLDKNIDFVGKTALARLKAAGAARKLVGLVVGGTPRTHGNVRHWPVTIDGERIGAMTAIAYSPRLESNVAFGLIDARHAVDGTCLNVETPTGIEVATLTKLPFVSPSTD